MILKIVPEAGYDTYTRENLPIVREANDETLQMAEKKRCTEIPEEYLEFVSAFKEASFHLFLSLLK